jgi:hypothetical protein
MKLQNVREDSLAAERSARAKKARLAAVAVRQAKASGKRKSGSPTRGVETRS